MPSRTVGERVGRVGERGIPLAKSVRRKRVWGEKCEHVPGVGARWGREGGEEGAETVHTLVSENEARARWERLQSFFTTFHSYRVGNPLDRKLSRVGTPTQGFFFPPNEGLQTSTRLITPAGSARIVEHRDELGAHEVPSTQGTARGATRGFL